MPGQCTLFCRRDSPDAALATAEANLRAKARTDVPRERWNQADFARGPASVRLHRTPFREPGDKLSKLILGLVNWLNHVAVIHPAGTKAAVDHILATQATIGFTALPDFSEDSGHFDCVFALAEELDALVWNGSALLNADGEIVIDGGGGSEVFGTGASPQPN